MNPLIPTSKDASATDTAASPATDGPLPRGSASAAPGAPSLADLMHVDPAVVAAAAAAEAASDAAAATPDASAAPAEAAAAAAPAADAAPADAPADPPPEAPTEQPAAAIGESAPASAVEPAQPFRPLSWIWDVAGFAMMAFGAFAVFGAPLATGSIAAWLAAQGDLRMHGAFLVVVGLLLVTIGQQRRSLSDVRRSLRSVREETNCIRDLAQEESALRYELEFVRAENEELSASVEGVQASITNLLAIVSHPDHMNSMYRLAASTDQLGRRIDISFRNQFDVVGRRMEFFAKDGQDAMERLRVELEERDRRLHERADAHAAAMREGLEERERRADEQQVELTARVDRFAVAQAALVREEAGRVERRIELAGQQQSSALTRQVEQVQGVLGARCAELQQLGERTRADVERATAGVGALGARVGELGARVEQRFDDCASAVDAGFAQLDRGLQEVERHGAARSEQLLERAQAGVERSTEAIAGVAERVDQRVAASVEPLRGSVERLDARVAQYEAQHAAALQRFDERTQSGMHAQHELLLQELRASADANARILRDLGTALDALCARVEERDALQRESARELCSRTEQSTHAVQVELEARIQRVGELVTRLLTELGSSPVPAAVPAAAAEPVAEVAVEPAPAPLDASCAVSEPTQPVSDASPVAPESALGSEPAPEPAVDVADAPDVGDALDAGVAYGGEPRGSI